MNEVMTEVILIVSGIVGVIMIFAQVQLFTVVRELRRQNDEILKGMATTLGRIAEYLAAIKERGG